MKTPPKVVVLLVGGFAFSIAALVAQFGFQGGVVRGLNQTADEVASIGGAGTDFAN